ncbi:hypothetical protein HDU80_004378 [Chytriomyces hyalinus]|nr:hypothetical protein HDU80_004378 [Chytriomyces hyalinus]
MNSSPCTSWTTRFTPVTNTTEGTLCAPPGTTLTECTSMTDGTNSLWYANKTLSATHSTQYGVGTFFSYTANMTRSHDVTFKVTPTGMGFYYSDTYSPGLSCGISTFDSSLCLRSTFPFLALVSYSSISWNETSNPPFYWVQDPNPPFVPASFSDSNSNSFPVGTVLLVSLGTLVLLGAVFAFRRYARGGGSSAQPVIRLNGQVSHVEALPVYQQSHEMGSIASAAPLTARSHESNAGLSVASGRVSVAPSASGSDILLLESWSVEEVAAWVRLNGAGRAGAEKVMENQIDGGVLTQLTVEEILQVFSLEDDYEKDKLREALAVLKANNGETPPVTLSATHSTQYGVNTFFSYTANLASPNVTFAVRSSEIGFFGAEVLSDSYERWNTGGNLCLRSDVPFLALLRDDIAIWDERTNPPFTLKSKTNTTTTKPSNSTSGNRFASNAPIYILVGMVILMVLSLRFNYNRASGGASGARSRAAQMEQPVIRINGLQPPAEEALPVYQQPPHEMQSIISISPSANAELNAGASIASRRSSTVPSLAGSEVLLLETWSVEEVARWVRLNGAGPAGAERVRADLIDGGVLKQLTVEEILQVFSLEDEYERDKLREALTVLKADNGEAPPVYDD